jgi:hypothetical protein
MKQPSACNSHSSNKTKASSTTTQRTWKPTNLNMRALSREGAVTVFWQFGTAQFRRDAPRCLGILAPYVYTCRGGQVCAQVQQHAQETDSIACAQSMAAVFYPHTQLPHCVSPQANNRVIAHSTVRPTFSAAETQTPKVTLDAYTNMLAASWLHSCADSFH